MDTLLTPPHIHDGFREHLISRFSIAITASLLLGMGCGSSIPEELSWLAVTAGSIGLIYYLITTWKHYRQSTERVKALRKHVERRLAEQTAEIQTA